MLSRLAGRRAFGSAAAVGPACLPVSTTTLSNGMRVASQDTAGDTATIGVFIDAGSRYENDANNGTAHFLEHMAFKGTERRTQQGLEMEVEDLGAQLNAYTSREQTVYHSRCFKKDIGKSVDILSDILLNSKFEQSKIEVERGVILREFEEVDGMTDEVIFDRLHETAFQGSDLGRTILGSQENIANISRDMLVEYINTHYTPDRIVLVGSGGVNHDELVKLADQHFGHLKPPPNHETEPSLIYEPSVFVGSDIRERDDYMDQAHVAIAVQGAEWTHPASFALMVGQCLLGFWDKSSGAGANVSSPLCRRVAQEGLANSIMAFNTCYSDTGLFGVYATAPEKGLDDLVSAIQTEMVHLIDEQNDAEMDRAKSLLKAHLFASMSGTTASCEDIGRQILSYGRHMSVGEICHRIDSVTSADVQAAAEHFIWDQEVAVASMGPLRYMPELNFMRRRTYFLRY